MRIFGAASIGEEHDRVDGVLNNGKGRVVAGEDHNGTFPGRAARQPERRDHRAFHPSSSDRAEAATNRRVHSTQSPAAIRHTFERDDPQSSPGDARSSRTDFALTSDSFTFRGAMSNPTTAGVFGNMSKVFNTPGTAVDRKKVPTGPRGAGTNLTRVPSGPKTGFGPMKDTLTGPPSSKRARSNRSEPHIFISASNLPAKPPMIKHVKRFFLGYGILSVLMDPAGYYITFVDTADGRRRLADCARRTKHAVMFSQYHLNPKVFYDSKEVTDYNRLNAPSAAERSRSSSPGTSILGRAKTSNTSAPVAKSDEIHDMPARSFAPRPLSLSPQMSNAVLEVRSSDRPQLQSVIAQIGSSTSPPAVLATPNRPTPRQTRDDASSVHSSTTTSSRSKALECRVCKGLGGAMERCRSCARIYHNHCRPQGSVKGSISLTVQTYWQCASCVRKGKPRIHNDLGGETSTSAVVANLPTHDAQFHGGSRRASRSKERPESTLMSVDLHSQPTTQLVDKPSAQQNGISASSATSAHTTQQRQSQQQSQIDYGVGSDIATRSVGSDVVVMKRAVLPQADGSSHEVVVSDSTSPTLGRDLAREEELQHDGTEETSQPTDATHDPTMATMPQLALQVKLMRGRRRIQKDKRQSAAEVESDEPKDNAKVKAQPDDLLCDGQDNVSDDRRAANKAKVAVPHEERVDTNHQEACSGSASDASTFGTQVQSELNFLHDTGMATSNNGSRLGLAETNDLDVFNEAQALVEQSFVSGPIAIQDVNEPKKLKFTRVKRGAQRQEPPAPENESVQASAAQTAHEHAPVALTRKEHQENPSASTLVQAEVEYNMALTLSQPATVAGTGDLQQSDEYGPLSTTTDVSVQGNHSTSPSLSTSLPQPRARRGSGFVRAKRSKVVSMKCNTCGKSVPFNPSGKSECTACKEKSAQATPVPEPSIVPADTNSPPLADDQATRVAPHRVRVSDPVGRDAHDTIPREAVSQSITEETKRPRKMQRKVAVDQHDLGDSFERPPHTYTRLIGMALCAANDNRASPQWVSQWIAANIPGYALDQGKWKDGIHSTMNLNAGGKSGKIIATSVPLDPLDTKRNARKVYELLPGLAEELEHWDPELKQPRFPTVTQQTHAPVPPVGKTPEATKGRPVPQRRSSAGKFMKEPEATVSGSPAAMSGDAMDIDHDNFLDSRDHEDNDLNSGDDTDNEDWTADVMRKQEVPTSIDASRRQEPATLNVKFGVQQDGGAETSERTTSSANLPQALHDNATAPLASASKASATEQSDHGAPVAVSTTTLPASTEKPIISHYQKTFLPFDTSSRTLVSRTKDNPLLTAADLFNEDESDSDDEEEKALLDMIKNDNRTRESSSRSLFADRPQYDPKSEAQRQAKIVEISQRPRRKDLIGRSAGYSILGQNDLFKTKPPSAPVNAPPVKKSLQPASLAEDSTSVQEFDSLKEFLGLPEDLVPAIMDEQLVYRHKDVKKRVVYRTGI